VLKRTVPVPKHKKMKTSFFLNSAIRKLYVALPTCAMRELQAISMDRPIETSFTPIGSNTWSSYPEQPIKSNVAGLEL
jgi:hypothetical protein